MTRIKVDRRSGRSNDLSVSVWVRRLALFLAVFMMVQGAPVSLIMAGGLESSSVEPMCGLRGHTHNSETSCYDRVLICTKPEIFAPDEDDSEILVPIEDDSNESVSDGDTGESDVFSDDDISSIPEDDGSDLIEVSETTTRRRNPKVTDELELHTHSEENGCYTYIPVCGQAVHTHDTDCYIEYDCVFGLTQHTHDIDDCYSYRLDCREFDSAHEHTMACYEKVLVCGFDESYQHTHTDVCEPTQKPVIEPVADMTDCLNHLVIKNAFDEIIYVYSALSNAPVFFYEESYSFAFIFRSPEVVRSGFTYTYEIPAGLKITEADSGLLYSDEIGGVIGSYQIVTGYAPHIEFEFNNTAEAAGAFAFGLNFSADFVKANETDAYAAATEEFVQPLNVFRSPMMLMAISSQTWDLENFVTGVSVRDKNGFPVTNGIFNYDENYTFSIYFAEDAEKLHGQFSYTIVDGKEVMIYQLPEELKIMSAIGWAANTTQGKIKLPNGKPAGDYKIDLDGTVYVTFYNVDNKGVTASGNFIHNYPNVAFRLDIAAQFKSKPEDGVVRFSAEASIKVDIVKRPDASLTVNKKVTKVDAVNETMSFLIDVMAVGDTVKDITFTDVMTFFSPAQTVNLTNYGTTPIDIMYGYASNQIDQPGKMVYDALSERWVLKDANGTNDLKVTLDKDQHIYISYTLNLKDIFGAFAEGGLIKRLMYNIKLNNTVYVTGEDSSGKTIPGSASTEGVMSKSFLSKSGVLSSTSDKITWTATVGDGKIPLNGLTIKDTLVGSTQKIVGNENDVIITFYDADNKLLSDVTRGTLADFVVTTGFTYKVPDSPAIYYVKFVYQVEPTTDDTLFNSGGFENKIEIEYESNISSYTGKTNGVTPIGTQPRSTKTSEWVYDASGVASAIKYTLEYTIPANSSGKGFYVLDNLKLMDPTYSGYYTFEANSITDVAVTLFPAEDTFEYQMYQWQFDIGFSFASAAGQQFHNGYNGNTQKNYKFDLSYGSAFLEAINHPVNPAIENNILNWSVNNNPTSAERLKWSYTEEKTITITYTLHLDRVKLNTGDITILRYFRETVGARLYNKASIKDKISDATFTSSSDVNNYYPIVKKGVPNKDDPSVFDYTVYLNYNKKGAIFEQGEAAIFEDTFDDRLEYVPGSFYVMYTDIGINAVNYDAAAKYYVGPHDFTYNTDKDGNYVVTSITDKVQVDDNKITVDFSKDFQFFGSFNESVFNEYVWKGTYEASIISSVEGNTGWMPQCPASNNNYYAESWNINNWGAEGSPINSLASKYWYSGNYTYVVHYQLRLKDNYITYGNGEDVTQSNMVNTASVTGTSEKYKDMKFSASATVGYVAPKPATKDMTIDGTIASAVIEINTLGQRLRPDGVKSSWFTAKDEMSETLAYYLNSVEIYYREKNSEGKPIVTGGVNGDGWIKVTDTNKANAGPANSEANPRPANAWEIIHTDAQHVSFVIPDETPIKIVYDALITVGAGDLSNTIEVWGESVTSEKKNFLVQETTGQASASLDSVTIFKEDADTGNHTRLAGAEFDLYRAVGSGGSFDASLTEYIEVNGINFYKLNSSPIKSGDGTYTFASTWLAARHSASGTVEAVDAAYLIVETKAPTNYEQVTDVNKESFYTFFVLEGSIVSKWKASERLGSTAVINVIADNMIITNKSVLGQVTIGGTKAVTLAEDTGKDETAKENVYFVLTQVNQNGTPYTETDAVVKAPMYTSALVWAEADKSFTFTFDTITGLKEGTYYFKVTESPGETSTGWSYDSTSYIVEVVVSGSGTLIATPTYTKITTDNPDGEPADAIVFTNTYEKPNPERAKAKILVNKIIDGTDYGETPPTFYFDLWQIEEDEKDIENDGIQHSIVIIGEGIGEFNLINLDKGSTYYFRIKERQEDIPAGWSYDKTEYIVSVEIARDGTATVTYHSSNENPAEWNSLPEDGIEFTNTYGKGGPKFAETGGIGRSKFTAIGLGLMLMSTLIAIPSIHVTKERKRPKIRK